MTFVWRLIMAWIWRQFSFLQILCKENKWIIYFIDEVIHKIRKICFVSKFSTIFDIRNSIQSVKSLCKVSPKRFNEFIFNLLMFVSIILLLSIHLIHILMKFSANIMKWKPKEKQFLWNNSVFCERKMFLKSETLFVFCH